MSATGRTTNYSLPLYNSGDTTAWLTSFNQAMNGIDTQMKSNETDAETALTVATNAESVANTASTNATTALANANTAQATAETAQTTATTANNKADTNTDSINVLEEQSLQETVTCIQSGWVANSSDSRYPYSCTVSATLPHVRPIAVAYGGNSLLSADVLALAETIIQFIYDSTAGTFTFYTTKSDVSSIPAISFTVRG